MRCTVETDRPDALAIECVLQCVAAAGMVSKVVVTASVILSSLISVARQGGLVGSPLRRFAASRLRQAVTVTRVIPSRLGMPRLVMPPAAISTISARRASAAVSPARPRLKFGALSAR